MQMRIASLAEVYMSRKRLLQVVGVLLCVPSAITFFVMVVEGIDSPLVYATSAGMYVGFAVALYATLVDD